MWKGGKGMKYPVICLIKPCLNPTPFVGAEECSAFTTTRRSSAQNSESVVCFPSLAPLDLASGSTFMTFLTGLKVNCECRV